MTSFYRDAESQGVSNFFLLFLFFQSLRLWCILISTQVNIMTKKIYHHGIHQPPCLLRDCSCTSMNWSWDNVSHIFTYRTEQLIFSFKGNDCFVQQDGPEAEVDEEGYRIRPDNPMDSILHVLNLNQEFRLD